MKKLLQWLLQRWKWCLWVLAVIACLVVFGLFLRADRQTVENLTTQTAAQRWETEQKPYSLSTVFLQDQDAVPQTAIPEIRLAVENAMTGAGVAAEDYPWLFAFSRTEQVELKNGVAGTDVEMTLISGDYFKIHPMTIRHGWYLDESEVMRDRIILDRQTAWDLFYSDNVVGQYLEWNGHRYVVAAVVDLELGKHSQMAAGDAQRAWAFADSPAADTEKGFTCVEMVLPQPVEGFGVSTMQSVLESYLPKNATALDNSNRFSLFNRWEALKTISTRWITNQAIIYPYYENAARLVENHLALRLIPEALLVGFAGVSVFIWLLILNGKRTWGLHSIPKAIERAIEKKRTREYEARLRGEDPKKKPKKQKKQKKAKKLKKPKKVKKKAGVQAKAPRRKYRPKGTGLDYSSRKYGTTKRRR